MDPDANLSESRTLADDILGSAEVELTAESVAEFVDRANRLAELTRSLDEWIARGGYLPLAWDPATRNRTGE